MVKTLRTKQWREVGAKVGGYTCGKRWSEVHTCGKTRFDVIMCGKRVFEVSPFGNKWFEVCMCGNTWLEARMCGNIRDVLGMAWYSFRMTYLWIDSSASCVLDSAGMY